MILSALLRTHVNPASSPTKKNSQLQRLACSYLILNAIRALRNPFQMTMLAILSLLLVIIPLSLSEPICQDPSPSASYIPNLVDYQDLIKAIFAASILRKMSLFFGAASYRTPSKALSRLVTMNSSSMNFMEEVRIRSPRSSLLKRRKRV